MTCVHLPLEVGVRDRETLDRVVVEDPLFAAAIATTTARLIGEAGRGSKVPIFLGCIKECCRPLNVHLGVLAVCGNKSPGRLIGRLQVDQITGVYGHASLQLNSTKGGSTTTHLNGHLVTREGGVAVHGLEEDGEGDATPRTGGVVRCVRVQEHDVRVQHELILGRGARVRLYYTHRGITCA